MNAKVYIVLVTAYLYAISCSNTPPPKLELSPQNITLDSNGAPSVIEVKSNVSWKVATIPDWLVVHPISGYGDALIQISGLPNTAFARTIDIQIISTEQGKNLSASVRVLQQLINFSLSMKDVFLENDGTVVTVTLNSDADWSIQNYPEWAMVSPDFGKGNAVIEISASVNEQKRDRAGSISFGYHDRSVSLTLTQKGDVMFNRPPDKPNVIYPLDHSIDVSTYPHFAWSCSDPDDDPITYTICLSPDGVDFVEYGPFDITNAYLDVELSPLSTYYLKIRADDGDHGITYSDTYRFTTGASIYADGEVILYMQSNKPKPVILVFTGDGYVPQDCNVGGLFEQNAAEGIEALFGVEPYKTYRDYFSVYIVFAHSLESGATQKNLNIYKQTAFSTAFEDTSTRMSTNTEKAFEYARKIPEMAPYGINNTCVIMMVNQDRYAGTALMWLEGRSVAICPVSRNSNNQIFSYANLLLHEAGGHGFGGLADEYITYSSRIPESLVANYRTYQNAGLHLNVDFTNDPQKILWSDFLGLPGYDNVGVYEGGALYSSGVWRSEMSSCMINNIKYFNVASRAQIVKRILTISGEGYTLEKFVEKDWVKAPGAETEMGTKSFDPRTFIPLAPPVIVW